jgi:hypothetical protein
MRTLSTVLCAALLLLARANMGFEISDADMFAGAFAPDAVYRLE